MLKKGNWVILLATSTKLEITRIADDVVIIKKTPSESRFFILAGDSIIISMSNLTLLLNYLVKNKYIHPSALTGIVEEYHTL